MYCNNCGKEVDEKAAFCGSCGSRTDGSDMGTTQSNNTVTNEIGEKRKSSKLKVLFTVLVVFVGIVIFYVSNSPSKTNGYIDIVKEGAFFDYPDKTLGSEFSKFFDKPRWTFFTTDDKENIVEFKGGCQYDKVDVTVKIQFTVYNDDTFEVTYFSMNDISQSIMNLNALIETIMEEAEEEEGNGSNYTMEEKEPVTNNSETSARKQHLAEIAEIEKNTRNEIYSREEIREVMSFSMGINEAIDAEDKVNNGLTKIIDGEECYIFEVFYTYEIGKEASDIISVGNQTFSVYDEDDVFLGDAMAQPIKLRKNSYKGVPFYDVDTVVEMMLKDDYCIGVEADFEDNYEGWETMINGEACYLVQYWVETPIQVEEAWAYIGSESLNFYDPLTKKLADTFCWDLKRYY